MGWIVLEPPPQYVHPFKGPVIERVLPVAEARRACSRMGAWADACAWVWRGKCYIVIPHGGIEPDLRAYRRHEIAHCNGWPASHKTADRWDRRKAAGSPRRW